MFHLNWVEPLSKFVGGLPESTRLDLSWAEAPIKIARMTLTIKLDGDWSSFQIANNTPPLSVTGSVIAPSARMLRQAMKGLIVMVHCTQQCFFKKQKQHAQSCHDCQAANIA